MSRAPLDAKLVPAGLTSDAVHRIFDILSILENGKLMQNYGSLSVLPDGAGFSYGIHQSTDRADSTDKVVERYIQLGGTNLNAPGVLASLRADQTVILPPATTEGVRKATWPAWAITAAETLISLGNDPTMQRAQDEVFAENYWIPSIARGQAAGLKLALSYNVLYDTAIQSGPGAIDGIRKMFPELPPARGGDEKEWARAYIDARERWLANYTSSDSKKQALVRRTTYRTKALRDLAIRDVWAYTSPFTFKSNGGTFQIS